MYLKAAGVNLALTNLKTLIMKTRIILALTFCLSLITLSCDNSDNNNGSDNSVSLVGKWNAYKVGTIIGGQEILTNPPQNEKGCEKDYIEFKVDNTLIAGDYDSSESPCQLQIQAGTYTRSGGTIVTVIDGTNRTEQILNLTATELKIKDETGAIAVFSKE